MTTSLQDQKREYLRRAVERLKAEKGMTQRSIAEDMEETEQELSGKLSLKSQRTITDEYLDRFAQWSGIPFSTGDGGAPSAALEQKVTRMEESLGRMIDLQTTIIDFVLKKAKPEHREPHQ